jgi:hypothetical protein
MAAAMGAVRGERVHPVDNDNDDLEPDNLNVDRLLPVVQSILSDLTNSSSVKTFFNCIDSSPLLNVTLTSLKTVPYALISNSPIELGNGLSCRLRYLESAVMGLASMVYNLFIGVILSVATAATFGRVPVIADQMKKTWMQTGLAAVSAGIGFIGTAVPKAGVLSNVAIIFGMGVVLQQIAEQNLVTEICTVYRNHAAELREALADAVGDANLHRREVVPLLNYLDNASRNTHTFTELWEVVQGSIERSPAFLRAAVYAGRDAILHRGENFLDGLQEDFEGVIG